MDGALRPFVILVALVMASAFFAGCSDSADDEMLREGAIKAGDVDVFNVPEGTERLKFTFSTRGDVDCGDPRNAGAWECIEQWGDSPEEDEQIAFMAAPAAEFEAGRPLVLVTLAGDDESSKTIIGPTAGAWYLAADTPGGAQVYEGPASADVAIPAAASGDGVLNLGPFWDIFGVVIALVGFLSAWIIYRRRARFMSNQLHRIDDTFTRFGDDLSECRTNLIELKKELNVMLFKRKLEEPQYLILEKRIEQYLRDLEVPGNRHAPAPVPQFVTVLESEEESIGPGSALDGLRQRRTAED